jgi:hypothetical protein
MIVRKMTLAFCMAASLFGADDLFTGTWKLNLAKSKYAAGQGPQSATATVKGEGGTHAVNAQMQTAEGQPIEFSYVAKDDGTPAPVTGSPVFDMISARKINDHTVERRLMKAGKTVGQDRVTVSSDGTMLTLTGSGQTPKGVKTRFTAVYEKQ